MNRAPRLTLSLPVVFATLGTLCLPDAAAAACIEIRTVNQLHAMRNDLAGAYCLANDIDASTRANFIPIGTDSAPFTGTFHGRGRVIRNLTIDNDASNGAVGLFGVTDGATIRDVSVINANVQSPAATGILIGEPKGATQVLRARTHGRVECTGTGCYAGGLIGNTIVGTPLILDSSSSATVRGAEDATIGGLVGELSQGTIRRSYATGNVSTTGSSSVGGGLVGFLSGGAIDQSFATGRILAVQAGGLVGQGPDFGSTIIDSYAAGPVRGSNIVGGLVGHAGSSTASESTASSYSVGAVTLGATQGGLVGTGGSMVITNSYWDTGTSGQAASDGGAGRTTTQLRHNLQTGFTAPTWAITRGFSYPYLADARIDFASPLATLVVDSRVFVFVPISQREPSEYRMPPANLSITSQAAAYTMIGRAIGNLEPMSRLINTKIDRFWNETTNQPKFGRLADYATLGPLRGIPAAKPLDNTNVVGAMRTRNQVVMLRGTYMKGSGPATHWLLGTLFKTNADGTLRSVVANDPWTGMQIEFDPATKTVVAPADFPLRNLTVNGYQTVTIN